MAKLNTYSTWLQSGRVYWESEIDTAVEAQQSSLEYNNTEKEQMRTALKSEMNSYMDSLNSKALTYESDNSKRERFVGILLSVATYIMGKDIAATPEAPVTPITVLPNDDLRDLFAWWREDLPAYQNLFTIYIAMESTNPEDPLAPMELVYEMRTNSAYTTLSGGLDVYSENDLARFDEVVEQSGSSQIDRAAYLLFAGPNAVIVRDENTDLNDKILTDYHGQEILDTFGWTVKGLNG